MIFGVDYYPEHWEKKDWKEHARLMREGNFNTVRLAEFAWGRIEIAENRFDFSWLDEAIEILAAEGIQVILGTPTAAPPKWLVNKYDIFLRDRYGRSRGFGSRRACCSNHPDYIARSAVVVTEMAKHYANHPNVIAWQIDNEFGCHNSTQCYCEYCQEAFAKWLKERYHDINNLNQSYGTVFWSQEYANFTDVILPKYTSCQPEDGYLWAHNPSLDMDFQRFSSDSWVNYQQRQLDILHNYIKTPITHNLMGHFSSIDYYKLGKELDIVSWDNYIENQWNLNEYESTSMAHELMRGIKNKNFWVMEQQSGPCGWNLLGGTPRPGQLRLWTYQAIAHGCEGIIYFRFKTALFGIEQFWYGVLDHDGIPRRRYYELQKTGAEIRALSHLFVNAKSEQEVLIVKSYEDYWSHRITGHVKAFDYRDLLYLYYQANSRVGIEAACGSVDMISSEYKVVYMPACAIVTEEICQKLETYVEKGGCLVLTYRSGVKDENNNMTSHTLPGRLRDLAGVVVTEFDSTPVEVPLSNGFGYAKVWKDILEPVTAATIAVYDGDYYNGSAAITRNNYGKGSVWYIGCDLERAVLLELTKQIADETGVGYISHPDGTEIVRRKVNDTNYIMLLNYTEEDKHMEIKGKSLINGTVFNGNLGAYEVEIIQEYGQCDDLV